MNAAPRRAAPGPRRTSDTIANVMIERDGKPVPARPARKRPSLYKRLQIGAALLLGKAMIHTIGRTVRLRLATCHEPKRWITMQESFEFGRGDGGPVIYAIWHGCHFPPFYAFRNRGICAVTSPSADGQILGRLLRGMGYQTVAGSSSRQGTRALVNLTRRVQGGADAVIAIDGPRGPAYHVKPGVILLAKMTGRPIVPLATSAKRYWRFQSWDRFRLPLPLTTTFILGDEPMRVPPDADHDAIESMRVQLEQRMRAIQKELDDRVRPRIWRLPDRDPRDKRHSSQVAELE